MALKDKILSEQNIFTAIYSLESYVFEKGLLDKDDIDLYNRLSDKYNDCLIRETIKRCQDKIQSVLTEGNLFDVKVYFKLKKYDEDVKQFVFRPIHTADLISQISMVSMLLPLMYKDEESKREFSELAKLMPHNFYGNIPSSCVDNLFIKWQYKYKQYSEAIIHKSKEYKETRQYKNEVCMDLKDFFPSIDPCYIYGVILKLMSPLYEGEDRNMLKLVLSRLLFFTFREENFTDWLKEYYPNVDIKQSEVYITRGIAQGLPQSYFFGNVCMIQVANEIKTELDGDAYYYVDDSVVFTNKIKDQLDFECIINNLNEKLKNNIKGKESKKECMELLPSEVRDMALIIPYTVSFHPNKSFYNPLTDGADNTGGLQYLTRQVSMAAVLSNNLDDDEDSMSLAKLDKLIEVINQELKKLKELQEKRTSESEYNYSNNIKLLKRHKKYFLFRQRLLKMRNEGEVSSDFWNSFVERFRVGKDGVSEKVLSEELEEEIFQSESRLVITCSSEDLWTERYEQIAEWEKKLAKNRNSLYYKADLSGAKIYSQRKSVFYESLSDEWRKKSSLKSSVPESKKWILIKEDIKKWRDLQMKDENYACFVRRASDEYTRKYYNALFSFLYNVEISDQLSFAKINNRCVNYTELRILAYLRNRHFKQTEFEDFLYDIYDRQDRVLGNMHIDMAILEVLHILITTVKNPKNVDDIILTHRVVSAMWKNGSKFLNAYTLHNEDHAICLIKQCKKILSVVDYLGLKQDDYYVLFLACYLHDISMVIHPDLNLFNLSTEETDRIATKNRLRYVDAYTAPSESYHELLLKTFNDIYGYFENEKRSKHSKESATYIRHHSKDFFNYLSKSIIELVAKVSESHGYDAIEVYGRKSKAKSESYSLKYMMILIRLADLMDMSNDRVNYYRLRESLNSLSEVSKFHWISHLVTDKANIRATYQYDPEKRLWEYPLTETIHIDLFLNVSYTAAIDRKSGCRFCVAQYWNSVSNIGIDEIDWKDYEVMQIKIKNDEYCDAYKKKSCPIICAWMQKKNGYLALELNHLGNYLNKVNTRLFTTEFEIDLIFDDTHKLDSDMFDSVHDYLRKVLG